MNNLPGFTSPAKPKQPPSVNPFAKAMMENENTLLSQGGQSSSGSNPLAEALARSGGSFGDLGNFSNNGMGTDFSDANPFGADPTSSDGFNQNWFDQDPAALQRKQEEARINQEKELLRKKLHDQINPVRQEDVFSAREEQVKKKIEELRKDLRAMAREIKAFNKEIDLTLLTETAEPGLTGSYFVNFFHQLRQLIRAVIQRMQSAKNGGSWMTSSGAKHKKKPKRGGILIEGQQREQTTSVYDMMHHERSATYGGS